MMNLPSARSDFLRQQTRLLLHCYEHLFATSLVAAGDDNARIEALFNAPFAVVSHNTAHEPVFNYANAKALELFEFSWDEFTCLPSRLSAEPMNQAERDTLLASVREQGFIRDYHGIRLSKTGRRFQIKNAVVWNLFEPSNVYRGQAACFKEWTFL